MKNHETKDQPNRIDLSQLSAETKIETASLKEHQQAQLDFLSAKTNLLSALNQRLEENDCGPLRSLHYRALLEYMAAVENKPIRSRYSQRPALHLEAGDSFDLGVYDKFKIFSLEAETKHVELLSAVIASRNALADVFKRLSKEDQKSLLPATQSYD